jgi:hypothetical protein
MKWVPLYLTTFVFTCLSLNLSAQENAWMTLSKISFQKEYDELLGFKVDKPVFSEAVKKLDGETIRIKGYIVPVEGYKNHTEFILTQTPLS